MSSHKHSSSLCAPSPPRNETNEAPHQQCALGKRRYSLLRELPPQPRPPLSLGRPASEPVGRHLFIPCPLLSSPTLSCLPLLKAVDKVRKSGQIIYFNPSLSFPRPCAIYQGGGEREKNNPRPWSVTLFQMWNQSPLGRESVCCEEAVRGGDEFLCGFWARECSCQQSLGLLAQLEEPADLHVSSHLMARAQQPERLRCLGLREWGGMGSAVQARPSGQRRGSASWYPSTGSSSSPGSRLGHAWHFAGMGTVPSGRNLGVCPRGRAPVPSPEK